MVISKVKLDVFTPKLILGETEREFFMQKISIWRPERQVYEFCV